MEKRLTGLKKLEEVAQEHHWGIRNLGKGEVLKETVFQDGWWYEPMGESTMHPLAAQRMEVIKQSGVSYQGFIVAHETTFLLNAPAKQEVKTDWGALAKTVGKPALVVVGGVVVALAVVGLLMAVLPMFAVLLVFLVPMSGVDPALIVVLQDGTMVEVARWYND